MPDFADLDALGTATVYVVVIGIVFAECGLLVGFFLPGDTLLFGGGLIAADAARGVDVGWLLGVLIAAVAGRRSVTLIGAPMGLPMLAGARPGDRPRTGGPGRSPSPTGYGVLAVVWARWIPWIRTFAAGRRDPALSWPKFLLGNVVGALCSGADAGAGRLPGGVGAVDQARVARGRRGGDHRHRRGDRAAVADGSRSGSGDRRPVASSGAEPRAYYQRHRPGPSVAHSGCSGCLDHQQFGAFFCCVYLAPSCSLSAGIVRRTADGRFEQPLNRVASAPSLPIEVRRMSPWAIWRNSHPDRSSTTELLRRSRLYAHNQHPHPPTAPLEECARRLGLPVPVAPPTR